MPGATELTPLELPSGFNRNTTPYGAEGYYVSGTMVRFRYGKPQTIGGFEPEILSRNIDGVTREALSWRTLDGTALRAFGTNKKVEILKGGTVTDVTPVRATVTISNNLHTVSGSPIVKVSTASHNAFIGDYVYFTSATSSLNGISINGKEYEVVTVYGVDSFGVSGNANATATSTNTGGSTTVNYLYYTGLVDNGVAFGYGTGTYGTYGTSVCAGYGEPRGSGIGTKLRLWSLDNWGQDLVANPEGGKIYQWDASVGVARRLQEVTAAPSVNSFILAAKPQRQLVAFGTHNTLGVYDPNLIRWCSSENLNDWTASVGNNAGSYRVNSGSGLKGAVNTRGEILVLTDDTAISMAFTGDSLVYNFKDLGSKTDLISKNAIVDVNGTVYWMGTNNFYKYDGVVQVLPCDIHQFIFNSEYDGVFNPSQKEKVECFANSDFDEVWWFYPDKNNLENNRYVVYNYVEKCFYDGLMSRTAALTKGVFSKPQMVDANGNLWTHEQGDNAGGAALKKTLETSYFDLSSGQNLMFVDRFVPDFELIKNINITIDTKKYPTTQAVTKGPYTITPSTEQIKFRVRGRQASVRFSTSATDSYFRLGLPRFGVQPNGER